MTDDLYKIVETDNFDGDYPDEKFVNIPATSQIKAQRIAQMINEALSGHGASRFWKVVPTDYELQGGFEP